MSIVLIPIDNRPVTYLYPQLVAKIAAIEPLTPPRELLGSLNEPAKMEEIYAWLSETIKNKNPEAVLVCLDTLLHGGLITSRRSEESVEQILSRLDKLIDLQKNSQQRPVLLAQSSIMRISDNYDNTEEKSYWKDFGRELFAWSSELHKSQLEKSAPQNIALLEGKIPSEIRQDYLATRKRNHAVNLKLLDHAEQGLFKSLIFSQDDSGQFGLNVSEKQQLQSRAAEKNLAGSVFAYAGADEVLCTLIARYLASKLPTPPKALVRFSTSGTSNCPSRYEGQTIGESLTNQMTAAGINRVTGAADFFVIVHGNETEQGDHIVLPGMDDKSRLTTARSVKQTLEYIATSQYPCVICDVAYANGADPVLVSELLERPDLLQKLWGYGGWNTTGNTIGSVLATAAARFYAKASDKFAETENYAKQALFVRLLDDWAYQTQVRTQLKGNASKEKLHELLMPYAKQLAKALEYEPGDLNFSFPWNRTFEVEA